MIGEPCLDVRGHIGLGAKRDPIEDPPARRRRKRLHHLVPSLLHQLPDIRSVLAITEHHCQHPERVLAAHVTIQD